MAMTRSQAAKRLRWAGLITGVALVALETLRFKPWRLLPDGRLDVLSILYLLLFLANIVVAWKSSRIGGILFFGQSAVWPALIQGIQRLNTPGAAIQVPPIAIFFMFGLSKLVVGVLFYLSHAEEQKSPSETAYDSLGLLSVLSWQPLIYLWLLRLQERINLITVG